MTPKLAGQYNRRSPRRGKSTEPMSTLNESTSTNDTSKPRVVPRYQSRLTKFTSISSVTAESETMPTKNTLRTQRDTQLNNTPPPAATSSSTIAIKSFRSIDWSAGLGPGAKEMNDANQRDGPGGRRSVRNRDRKSVV